MELCALCRKPGTNRNPINRHHIQGRKKHQHLPIMRVHSFTCHSFAQWITNLYLEAGLEEELNENIIVYFYNRVIGLRHGDDYVLHILRAGRT